MTIGDSFIAKNHHYEPDPIPVDIYFASGISISNLTTT